MTSQLEMTEALGHLHICLKSGKHLCVQLGQDGHHELDVEEGEHRGTDLHPPEQACLD